MRKRHAWQGTAAFIGLAALVVPSTRASAQPPEPQIPASDDIVGGLTGVSAASTNDVWAVGYDASIPNYKTLTMHWNGKTWSRIPSPSPGGRRGSRLNQVSADSATDAWAVGYVNRKDLPLQPLIEHWDGTRWRIVDLPKRPKPWLPYLVSSVIALSPTDVWVVGEIKTLPLIMHWDGTRWIRMAGARLGDRLVTGSLNAVTANSPNDVWVAGEYGSVGEANGLLEHWNGATWMKVDVTGQGGSAASAYWGLDAISESNVWAVGEHDAKHTSSISDQWTGTGWHQVKTPHRMRSNQLLSVSGTGSANVWAVGDVGRQGRILHWDGTAWSPVRDNISARQVALEQVVALTPHDCWLVGGTGSVAHGHPLVEHWNGRAWTIIS